MIDPVIRKFLFIEDRIQDRQAEIKSYQTALNRNRIFKFNNFRLRKDQTEELRSPNYPIGVQKLKVFGCQKKFYTFHLDTEVSYPITFDYKKMTFYDSLFK